MILKTKQGMLITNIHGKTINKVYYYNDMVQRFHVKVKWGELSGKSPEEDLKDHLIDLCNPEVGFPMEFIHLPYIKNKRLFLSEVDNQQNMNGKLLGYLGVHLEGMFDLLNSVNTLNKQNCSSYVYPTVVNDLLVKNHNHVFSLLHTLAYNNQQLNKQKKIG